MNRLSNIPPHKRRRHSDDTVQTQNPDDHRAICTYRLYSEIPVPHRDKLEAEHIYPINRLSCENAFVSTLLKQRLPGNYCLKDIIVTFKQTVSLNILLILPVSALNKTEGQSELIVNIFM